MKITRTHISLFVIITLSLFLRLLWLDKVPIGISDDELDYVFNAKAVFLTGRDITGTWMPFSLTTPPGEYPKAELPYVLIAPFIGSMPFSLFAARLPFALVNILLVVSLYFIAANLFGRKHAFVIGLLAAINPWAIYFGRTSFDAPVSIVFFLFSFYLMLKTSGWKILFVFPLLFLGFYTYIGAKVILIPFVLLASFFSWTYLRKRQYKKQYIILCLLSFLLISYFFFSLQSSKISSRRSELLTFNHPSIVQEVDTQRRLAIGTPVNELFINKLSILSKISLEKFVGLYSPQFLFLYGEGRATFSVWHHGVFYYLDAVFLGIGFYALYRKRRTLFFLFIGMLIIAPLPSLLSTTGVSYVIRSALVFPFLILIIGSGISYFIDSEEVKHHKSKFILLLFFAYTLLLANFMHIYFVRNPIYNSEGFGFSGRVLSKYVDLASKAGWNVVFVGKTTPDTIPTLFKQYIFYTNSYNKVTSPELRTLLREGDYTYKSLSIINCPEKPIPLGTVIITVPDTKCETIDKEAKHNNIAQLSDGGAIYNIFNDNLCKKYNLSRYPAGITLKDFDVENLSEERFCTQFITQFR